MRDFSFNLVAVPDPQSGVASTVVMTSQPLVLSQEEAVVGLGKVLPVPGTGHLTVFGDEVTIYGTLLIPGYTVNIICRKLTCLPGQETVAPGIDVTGQKNQQTPVIQIPKRPPGRRGSAGSKGRNGGTGQSADTDTGMNGSMGKGGQDGKSGGTIRIACLDLHAAEDVAIVANGSDGTNGQPGGDGQPGGPGGPGYEPDWFIKLWGTHATKGGRGGNGGRGGRGGDAGAGGAPGRIQIRCAKIAGKGKLNPAVNSGEPGQPGAGGAEGAGGPPGEGGKEEHVVSETSGPHGPVFERVIRSVGDLGYGTGGGSDGPGGKQKKLQDGTPEVNTSCCDKDIVTHVAGVFRTPDNFEQLEMLYRATRLDLLASSSDQPEDLQRPFARLRWLTAILAALSGHSHSAGGSNPVIDSLEKRVASIFKNAASGANIFGHEADWVPLGDYAAYTKNFDEMLSFLKEAEATTDDLIALSNETKATVGQAKLVIAHARAAIKTAEEQLKTVEDAIPGVVRSINALVDKSEAAKTLFTKQAKKFEDKIVGQFGLTPENVLQSLGTLSFINRKDPMGNVHRLNQAFMVASESGKMASDAIKKVTTSSGQQIDQSYVINQMEELTDDVETLEEAFHFVNGKIIPDDPNGYQLRATQQSVDRLLKEFRNLSEAQDLRDTLDDYVVAVTARNAKLIEYNHLFGEVAELTGLIQSYQASINDTEAKMQARTLPNLPAIKNFISGVYYRSQEDCIRAMDILSRSFNYYNLTDGDALAEILKHGNPTQINALTLGAARESLESYLFKNPIRGQKPFPDPTAGSAQPIRMVLERSSYPEVFEEFLEKKPDGEDANSFVHSLHLPIPSARYSASADPEDRRYSPFAGMGNVRLWKVRAFFPQLVVQADDQGRKQVRAHILHTGEDRIIDHADKTVRFVHPEYGTDFRYDPDAFDPADTQASIIEDGDLVHDARPDMLPEMTRMKLSPFTIWRLSLHSRLNPGLDACKVDKLILEFFGNYGTFDADG